MRMPNTGVDELRALIGPAQFRDFAHRFVNELELHLAELEFSEPTSAQLAAASHKIVAIAGALGQSELAKSSAWLTQCAKSGEHSPQFIAAISRTLELGRKAIEDVQYAVSLA
jgi:hypothetical protein